ncbi:MAG: hypothetical protein KAI79_16020 [Bacteroidales bacterium]|nr:hypothetical protein [Bacteroidales bacterium]
MNGFHEEAISSIETVLGTNIPKKDQWKVDKVILLCCFASFFGHNNLNQVLKSYQNTSSNLYGVYNILSYRDFSEISAMLMEHFVSERLKDIGLKGESTWSRLKPTYIIDASIFKIWLQNPDNEFFDKFFSRQTRKGEYGYKITLGGIAIDDTFYPVSFYVSSKAHTDAQIAEIIMYDMHRLTQKIKYEHNLTFGQWYLSVDSGYSDPNLLAYATEIDVIPICVPVKAHKFEIDNLNINLKEYIDKYYIPQEEEYYQKNKTDPKPFVLRKKAYYKCRNCTVILLFFRLTDSKKVSVIYTTDTNVKAKTLRRSWFKRTQIEQFFRFCKHILDFAASTYSNVNDFLKKVCLFFIKALFCNEVRNEFRKIRGMKKITFGTIRAYVRTNRTGEQWLINLMNLQEPF